jgi:hypothetical protein
MPDDELRSAVQPLISSGFFQSDSIALAPRKQIACLEREKKEEKEKEKELSGGRVATRPAESDFDKFWKAYPRRDGANPKAPAARKFSAIVRSGTDPQEIIDAAKRYAAEMRAKCQERTPYVAQAITWLNQQRWADYSGLAADESAAKARGLIRIMPDTEQWEAWRKARGRPLPVDRDGGWWCPTEWPPEPQGIAEMMRAAE